jgi:protein O-mannosyl-transferase
VKESWKSVGLPGALIVLLTIVAYLPALHCGFIWDDDDHLTNNPAMLSVTGLKRIWSSLAVSRYYPLTLTSFWVQRRVWGLDPLPYHAVNIALQAINAVLLWALLRRLQVRGAWVAAAVWAVHPVNVETVAWVTELKNTQSGLFFLLAVLAFLRFEDGLRPRDYVMTLVFAAAAMLSKPSTVVLPGVMLLCAWWRRGRWTHKDFLRMTPLIALAVAMSLLTILEQRHHIEAERPSEWTLTAAQRLVLAGRAMWFYAGKLLWPADFCFIYPRWALQAHSVVAWLPLTGLVVAAATLWYFRYARWARAATFGLGCFIVALLPVLGFLNIYFFRYSFVADHFQYLASMGLIALAVGTGAAISERAGQRGGDPGPFAAAVVLLVLGASTWTAARVYQDQETLWRDTLSKNPNAWIAHNNLGLVLKDQGKLSEATEHYEQVLRLQPDNVEAHNNLGVMLQNRGKVLEAMEYYKQALRIKPDDIKAHNNLGNALLELGKVPDAIEQYHQALRLKIGYAETYYNLGNALLRLGNVAEAIAQYQQALRIKPDYVEAYNNLGDGLLRLGKVAEAIGQYQQALRIKPDDVIARNNLGNALCQQDRIREAIEQYESALRLKPDYAKARYNLGIALYRLGKVAEAIARYRELLRLTPDWPPALSRLAWILATDPDASLRNGPEAVQFAQRLCEVTGYHQAGALDALAAAYAEAGRFNDAITNAEKAVELGRSAGQPELVGEIEARLDLYRGGRAYRQFRTPVRSQSADVTNPHNP